jgi:hypothetical protein
VRTVPSISTECQAGIRTATTQVSTLTAQRCTFPSALAHTLSCAQIALPLPPMLPGYRSAEPYTMNPFPRSTPSRFHYSTALAGYWSAALCIMNSFPRSTTCRLHQSTALAPIQHTQLGLGLSRSNAICEYQAKWVRPAHQQSRSRTRI